MSTIPKASKVFVAAIEIRPLDGCELSPEDYAGAAVRCYIPANTIEEARAALLETLSEERMELVETEFLVGMADVEWENPDDPIAGSALSGSH